MPLRTLPPEILPLQPVPLQELRLLQGGARWRVDQWLPELESLTPVRGELTAHWLGDVLQVSGQASTTLTLRCDRCLDAYDHPLHFHCQELIALAGEGEEEPPSFGGLDLSGLVAGAGDHLPHGPSEADGPSERLDPLGLFDPGRWLFEQLSLQRPCRNDCGAACPGPAVWSTAELEPRDRSQGASSNEPPPLDPRWARLGQLR